MRACLNCASISSETCLEIFDDDIAIRLVVVSSSLLKYAFDRASMILCEIWATPHAAPASNTMATAHNFHDPKICRVTNRACSEVKAAPCGEVSVISATSQ